MKMTIYMLCCCTCALASVNRWDFASPFVLQSFFGPKISQRGGSVLRQSKHFPSIEIALDAEYLSHYKIEGVLGCLRPQARDIFPYSVTKIEENMVKPVWCQNFEDVDSLFDSIPRLKKAKPVVRGLIELLFFFDIADIYLEKTTDSYILKNEKPTDLPEEYSFIFDMEASIRYVFREKSQRFVFESLKSLAKGYLLLPVPTNLTSSKENSVRLSFLNGLKHIADIENNYCARARKIDPIFDKKFAQFVLDVVEEDWEKLGLPLALAGYFATHEVSFFPVCCTPFAHAQEHVYFAQLEQYWSTIDSEAIKWMIADMTEGDQICLTMGRRMINWGKALIRRVLRKYDSYEPVLRA